MSNDPIWAGKAASIGGRMSAPAVPGGSDTELAAAFLAAASLHRSVVEAPSLTSVDGMALQRRLTDIEERASQSSGAET
jgi:hypothetical protein